MNDVLQVLFAAYSVPQSAETDAKGALVQVLGAATYFPNPFLSFSRLSIALSLNLIMAGGLYTYIH
jgi:hypothetical protein